jgi:ABC-type transporter Mla MlaB component
MAAPEPPRIAVLFVSGPVASPEFSELCSRVRASLEGSDADVVVCDVGGLVDPDAVAVEALARLQLTARRLGCRIVLLHACGELRDLIDFMGLDGVVPWCEELTVEPRGQPEEREPPGGVEEESDSRDLIS